jgi:hypothetical protein
MANVDRPNGLTPVRHLSGGTIRASVYSIAAAYATKIHSGSLVSRTGTGRNVQLCDTDGPAVGVFAGCEYVDVNGDVQFRPYWPAPGAVATGTTVKAFVFDDPQIVFEVQADEDVVEADIGQTADVVVGTGSDSTGRSATELDSSDINGTDGLLSILGLSDRPDNAYGTNAKVEVVIKLHELRSLAAV